MPVPRASDGAHTGDWRPLPVLQTQRPCFGSGMNAGHCGRARCPALPSPVSRRASLFIRPFLHFWGGALATAGAASARGSRGHLLGEAWRTGQPQGRFSHPRPVQKEGPGCPLCAAHPCVPGAGGVGAQRGRAFHELSTAPTSHMRLGPHLAALLRLGDALGSAVFNHQNRH